MWIGLVGPSQSSKAMEADDGEAEPWTQEERRDFAFAVLDALKRTHLPNIRHLAVDYKFATGQLNMSIKNSKNIIANNLLGQLVITMKNLETGALVHIAPAHVTSESQENEATEKNMTQDDIKRKFGKSGLRSILGFDHNRTIHEWFHKFTTLMSVYFLRVLYVVIVEAGALSKTMAYWREELEIPVSIYPKDGKEALSLKAGWLFMLLERAIANLETGGPGILNPSSSSHPLWATTVRRAASFLRLVWVSRLIFYATATETKLLRLIVRVQLMLVEEISNVFFFQDCGTCSTTNMFVALPREVDELVQEGSSLLEFMNGITQEGMHPLVKESLRNQVFSNRPDASEALAETGCRVYATFSVTEQTEGMNCVDEARRSMNRRQRRYKALRQMSGGNLPQAGLLDSKPEHRPELGIGDYWFTPGENGVNSSIAETPGENGVDSSSIDETDCAEDASEISKDNDLYDYFGVTFLPGDGSEDENDEEEEKAENDEEEKAEDDEEGKTDDDGTIDDGSIDAVYE